MASEHARITIPFGPSMHEAEAPNARLVFTGEFEELPAIDDFEALLLERLEQPTDGPPLRALAEGASRALVLVEDNTRHTPVDRILPVLFDHLNALGLADADIEILTASGTHRLMTDDEVLAKVGDEAYGRVAIAQHDCRDLTAIVDLEPVRAGDSLIPVQVNRKVLDAELIIGLGSIFPHSDAGFTGGAKIVQPGVCGTTTTAATHIAAALLDEIPLGDADNPCRLGMEEVAGKVGLSFIVNTVQDHRGRILEIVSGDFVAAHRRGAAVSRRAHGVQVPELADVVVASSHPGDIDWWQAEKCLVAAYFAVKPGGVIVFAGPCYEGLVHNHPGLRDWLPLTHAVACAKAAAIDPADSEADLIAADVAIVNAKVRETATILMVTEGLSEADVALLGYRRMPDLQTAVDRALELAAGDALGVLPYGGICLPIPG
jgi:nickel-dependent lactate racemase